MAGVNLKYDIPVSGDPGPAWAPKLTTALTNIERSAVLSLRAYGAAIDDATDDTAAVLAAKAAVPAGGVLSFDGPGVLRCDPDAWRSTKAFTVLGQGGRGQWSCAIKPRADVSTLGDPILDFNVAAPLSGARTIYGPGVEGVWIDLALAPKAVGFQASATTAWVHVEKMLVTDGYRSIVNHSLNSRMSDLILLDFSDWAMVLTDGGLQCNLTGVIEIARNKSGTATGYILVDITGTGGVVGDWRSANIQCGCFLSNGAKVTNGVVFQATVDTDVEIFSGQLIVDNVTGGGEALQLVHILNSDFAAGYFNASANGGDPGAHAVKISGGGNHRFRGNAHRGALGTYKFFGAIAGVSSRQNDCPSGPVYDYDSGATVTDQDFDDYCRGATVLSQVTNNAAKFKGSSTKRWSTALFQTPPIINVEPATVVGSGGGAPAFANSWHADTGSAISFYADPMRRVHLTGTITGGAAGTVAFTLPAGYQPAITEYLAVPGGSVTISPAGVVTLFTGATLSLSGISYLQNS